MNPVRGVNLDPPVSPALVAKMARRAVEKVGWRRSPEVVHCDAVRHPEFNSQLGTTKN